MSLTTSLNLRIDWSELDLFGHVNNVAFHKYAQAARLEFVSAAGLMELYNTHKIGFLVAETNCRFKKELLFPGTFTLKRK
ncbi:MAG: acyl-CoA thioesterase [Bacteroidota bacterium]|jgi:acyl-CoA thioester hydrolase|nr:acyl-CoA thioesterase [Bacteroidota bacterium]